MPKQHLLENEKKLTAQLERKNREILEFIDTVTHDLKKHHKNHLRPV
jgi:hypothetical protein